MRKSMVGSAWMVSAAWASVLAGSAARAEETARIERVVVFVDRAEITRVRKIECTGGRVQVGFPLLPASLDERTLRAEASGKAKVIGTTNRVVPVDVEQDARSAALEQQIEKLDDRIRQLGDAVRATEEHTSEIVGFSAYFAGIVSEEMRSPKPSTDAWKRALDVMKNEREDAGKKALAAKIELRKLHRSRARLQAKLSILRQAGSKEARSVSVAVECGGEPNVDVRLAYVLFGATWHPEYDLRFSTEKAWKVGKGIAELTVAAVVQQSTGEDWEDVEVALSTAKPKLGVEAPYPMALYVVGHAARSDKVLVQATERRQDLRGPGGETGERPANARLDDGGHVFLLTLPHRVTVRADGRPYWTPVDVVTAPAESKLVTAPKLKPYVYQVVTLRNPASYPLLAGRMHTYRSSSYVGDSSMEYVAPGEPMEASLGVDEELSVERKDLREIDKSASFLAATKRLEREYRIKVTNRALSRASVEVRENIPVSKSDEIKVELAEDKTTAGYRLDRDRGLITWTVDLGRGELKSVDLAYAVKLPKSWEVR